jgi:hypothetical protein
MDEDDRLPAWVALLGGVDLRAGSQDRGPKPKLRNVLVHGYPSPGTPRPRATGCWLDGRATAGSEALGLRRVARYVAIAERLKLPPAGRGDHKSAKSADAPMHQSREAHHRCCSAGLMAL